MFSPQSSSGFHQTPVCKALLGVSVGSSLALNFPLHQYKPLFVYSHSLVFEKHQFWRLLTAKVAFLDLKDLFICTILVYYFRVFERRYGSRKFASYLLSTSIMATLLELLAIYVCRKWEIPLDPFPSGPLCMVYPLFVPFFCDIPRVAMSHVLGVPVTGKSFSYILGLQVASGSPESIIVALSGILSGVLWRVNFLKVQSVIQIPRFIAKMSDMTLGRLLDGRETVSHSTERMGATLELQRQETMDRLEQQMLWQSLTQNRRNLQIGRPQPQNLANGPGIFGAANNNVNDGVRHRESNSTNSREPSPSASGEVSEDQVQLLVEMGFNQEQVRHALQVSNNDISVATNFLLQES